MGQAMPHQEDVYQKGFDAGIARRLAGYGRPYTRLFLISLLLILISSSAAVAGPYLVKMALDNGLEAGSLPGLRQAVLLYLLAALIQWATTNLRINVMARLGQSIIYDLRNQ